jgi:hypothetical protein
LATIAIKGKASSSKSLFPNLPKYTCLMAKESKKKVKSKASSSLKYVTSDEDTLSSDNFVSSDNDDSLPSKLMKNPNDMIKGLMKQVGARDELLEQQEKLLIQEREISEELKKLLALEKGKVERSFINYLLKARRLHVFLRAQLVLFKVNMMSCERCIKILKCNLMLFGHAHLKYQVISKLLKPLQAKDVKDVITLILIFLVLMLRKCLWKLVMRLLVKKMII